jgi:hypothetical protein
MNNHDIKFKLMRKIVLITVFVVTLIVGVSTGGKIMIALTFSIANTVFIFGTLVMLRTAMENDFESEKDSLHRHITHMEEKFDNSYDRAEYWRNECTKLRKKHGEDKALTELHFIEKQDVSARD